MVPGSFTTMGSTLDWVSSLRARLGYLVLPNLMAYGTVGGAWGKIDYTASNFAPGVSGIRDEHGLLQHPRGVGSGRRPRMDDYEQLAAARRISLLQSQQLPVRGGRRPGSPDVPIGLFVEQHQCERGAGRLELQVLILERTCAPTACGRSTCNVTSVCLHQVIGNVDHLPRSSEPDVA